MDNTMNNMLLTIAQRAGERITKETGDYVKDGLLMCGKCDTPKECILTIDNLNVKVPCLCRCAKKERDARINAEKTKKRQEYINKLRAQGIKDKAVRSWTFEASKPNKYIEFAKRYVNQWERVKENNIGLIFYGDTGRGKSHISACIANALIDRGVRVIYRTEADMLDELFDATDKEAYTERLSSAELLIIDDFGTGRSTEYAVEQRKKIIDKRYYSAKPTIITTNYTPNAFDNPKSTDEKRIFERIKAMAQFIEVKGENLRQNEASEKAAVLKELLKGENE